MDAHILNEMYNCFIQSVENEGIFNISLEKACDWLELKLSEDAVRNILDEYISEYSHLIIEEDMWFSGDWFSVEGFKLFCLFIGSPRARAILAHFGECSRKYEERKKEAQEEIKRLKEELKKAPGKLIKTAYERDEAHAILQFNMEESRKIRMPDLQ